MKIHMFTKDSVESIDTVHQILHSLPALTDAITSEFDPHLKGSIELEDLTSLITQLTQGDDSLRHHLEGFAALLELKNETKVFYSPFSTHVSPLLKYGR